MDNFVLFCSAMSRSHRDQILQGSKLPVRGGGFETTLQTAELYVSIQKSSMSCRYQMTSMYDNLTLNKRLFELSGILR